MKEKIECPHCKFINETFPAAKEMSAREYWIFTEVFCYLHGNKDYCDGTNYNHEVVNPVICDNPLHNIQVEPDGRCHWCEGKELITV